MMVLYVHKVYQQLLKTRLSSSSLNSNYEMVSSVSMSSFIYLFLCDYYIGHTL